MYDVTVFMLVPNLFVVSRITYSNHNNSCWCNISHNTLQCPGPPARFQVRDVSYTNRLNNGKDLHAVHIHCTMYTHWVLYSGVEVPSNCR